MSSRPAAAPTSTVARAARLLVRRAAAPPVHLVLGDRRHGVARYAAELATELGADVVRDPSVLVPGLPVHLHLTDRLLGATPAAAAAEVARLARRVRLTVTLHDVPQPTDGRAFAARATAYGRIVRAVRGWVTNSEHERALVARWCDADARGAVVPLPVPVPTRAAAAPEEVAQVVGVFGFVYPGKGHVEVVRAVAALRARGGAAGSAGSAGSDLGVLVAGGAAAGHEGDLAALEGLAAELGVPLRVTGHLADDDVAATLRSVAVPVVAHRNVSASGSLNNWLAAGRRPLLRDGAYAREMAALRPGTVRLFDDASLAREVDAALGGPASTWLAPGVDLRPHLADTAAAYARWWSAGAPGHAR
jgi:glycosyltransferase involved in cell wall biosynthesis